MNQESQHSRGPYAEQMLRLFGNWQVFDEEIQAAKMREFGAVWQEVGEDRFSLAVTAIINEGHYKMFPIISEFRGFLPASRKRQYCGECVEGWRYVEDPGCPRAVTPCQCRSASQ